MDWRRDLLMSGDRKVVVSVLGRLTESLTRLCLLVQDDDLPDHWSTVEELLLVITECEGLLGEVVVTLVRLLLGTAIRKGMPRW